MKVIQNERRYKQQSSLPNYFKVMSRNARQKLRRKLGLPNNGIPSEESVKQYVEQMQNQQKTSSKSKKTPNGSASGNSSMDNCNQKNSSKPRLVTIANSGKNYDNQPIISPISTFKHTSGGFNMCHSLPDYLLLLSTQALNTLRNRLSLSENQNPTEEKVQPFLREELKNQNTVSSYNIKSQIPQQCKRFDNQGSNLPNYFKVLSKNARQKLRRKLGLPNNGIPSEESVKQYVDKMQNQQKTSSKSKKTSNGSASGNSSTTNCNQKNSSKPINGRLFSIANSDKNYGNQPIISSISPFKHTSVPDYLLLLSTQALNTLRNQLGLPENQNPTEVEVQHFLREELKNQNTASSYNIKNPQQSIRFDSQGSNIPNYFMILSESTQLKLRKELGLDEHNIPSVSDVEYFLWGNVPGQTILPDPRNNSSGTENVSNEQSAFNKKGIPGSKDEHNDDIYNQILTRQRQLLAASESLFQSKIGEIMDGTVYENICNLVDRYSPT